MLSPTTTSQKLAFTKTRETQTTSSLRSGRRNNGNNARLYLLLAQAIRCDGVTDGRPAQKAGLKAGDIIIKVGDYTISSMDSYMQTLGKFQKGDKSESKIQKRERRNGNRGSVLN